MLHHCLRSRSRTRKVCHTTSDPACNKQLRAEVCCHQYWLEILVNIPWNKWQWDNFTDAVYQDISTVGRHVWAAVLGEFHPQKPRIPHQPGSTLRPRMCRQYLWTALHKEESSVSFASFTWYTEKNRENICQSKDKREGYKQIAATNAQPFVSRRSVSTSQLISLVCLQVHNLICQLLQHFSAPEGKTVKESVELDLLVVFGNSIMASATLLKSSFLPKKGEWGTTRQAAGPKPVTVSMVVHASAYADELVQTAVWFLNTSSVNLHFFNMDMINANFMVINFQNLVCINGKWCSVVLSMSQ